MAAYFPEDIAWKWEFISDSSIFDAWRDSGNEKLAKHIALLKSLSGRGVLAGIETEMMDDGRLCFDPAFGDKLDIVIGSVHFLPPVPAEDLVGHWLSHSMKLINSGIDILGHPFRWIAPKIEIGEDTVRAVVAEAKRCGVAIELNSHYKHPREDIMMLRACAETGAKVTIASDSHRKEEFGDYSYHMDIVEKAGYSFPGGVLVKTAIRH
jgi:histidinol phosphatase-like PHP family hydrolase